MAAAIPVGDLDLTHTSMAEVIHGVALAIASAQHELDRSSVAASAALAGVGGPDESIMVPFGREVVGGDLAPRYVSMVELGFVPTFYQFVDTVIEMKLSVSLRRSRRESGRRGGLQVSARPVDANFSSTYSYGADLAATVSTKIVPIPAPPALEDRIAAERERAEQVEEELAPRPLLAQGPDGPIDLNRASLEELSSLPRIGPNLAQAIVERRPIVALAELEEVDGISSDMVEQLRPDSER